MGRLCVGTHETSDIKAPLFLCGWVVGGFLEWVGGGGVGVMVGLIDVLTRGGVDGWCGGWVVGAVDGVGVVG